MKKWMWVVLAVVVIGGFVVLYQQDRAYEAALTGQTTATVTRAELHPGATDEDSDSTYVYYAFAVNGRQWEEFSILDDDVTADYAPGQQFPMCYNPQDPSQTRLALQLGGQCPAPTGSE